MNAAAFSLLRVGRLFFALTPFSHHILGEEKRGIIFPRLPSRGEGEEREKNKKPPRQLRVTLLHVFTFWLKKLVLLYYKLLWNKSVGKQGRFACP